MIKALLIFFAAFGLVIAMLAFCFYFKIPAYIGAPILMLLTIPIGGYAGFKITESIMEN